MCIRSQSNFGWLEPEPKFFRWWSQIRSQSLKFGFRIHRDSLWGKRVIQIIQCFFLIFWTKLFWSRSQKLLDVGAGTKKFRCPELDPEPEICVPAPQPWYTENLLALSLLCDLRCSAMETLSWELLIYFT